MKRYVFVHALRCLAHPLTLGAILVLLLNDHWLRYRWPSWWTGKLGDFTWLVFAPFLAALLFVWLIPLHVRNPKRLTAWLSFGFIGGWFILAKTIPTVHSLTTFVWEAIIGWEGTLKLDPTDLVTLPGLLVGWWIWRQTHVPAQRLLPRTWTILALGTVATLASDGPSYSYVDKGVDVICVQDDHLVIYLPSGVDFVVGRNTQETSSYQLVTYTRMFISKDGGLTWQLNATLKTEGGHPSYGQQSMCSVPAQTLTDPNDERVRYRWKPGEAIERSLDSGLTWIVDRYLDELHQDVRAEYRPSHTAGMDWSVTNDIRPGPRSGLIDPATGNLVLAMGWDGVLIRTVNGKWYWSAVGQVYQLSDLSDLDKMREILFFEFWLGGGLAILVLTTAAAYIRRRQFLRIAVLVIGWAGWGVLTIVLLPAYHFQHDFTIGLVAFVLLLLSLPMLVGALWDLLRNFRPVSVAVMRAGLLSALCYILPYLLWGQGTIPRYATATLGALVLTVASLYSGYQDLRPILPVVKPKKKQNTPSQ